MQFPRRSTTAVTIALVALTWLAAADARAQDFPFSRGYSRGFPGVTS